MSYKGSYKHSKARKDIDRNLNKKESLRSCQRKVNRLQGGMGEGEEEPTSPSRGRVVRVFVGDFKKRSRKITA